jgi:hypothetical protein
MRLTVYGDSFADTYEPGAWAPALATHLCLSLQSRAVTGSSTEYAFLQLMQDFQQGSIGSGDVVIFIVSSSGRLPFRHQNLHRPNTASLYAQGDPGAGDHAWYWQNRQHIEWWQVNSDYKLIDLNYFSYCQTVKILAEYLKSTTFIVIPAFKINFNPGILETVSAPANFLKPAGDFNLYSVSNAELISAEYDSDWREFIGYDVRANHLTRPNLNILVKTLEAAVRQLDISGLNTDIFQKNLLNKIINRTQYRDYISQGYLQLNREIYFRLPE